MMQVDVGVSGQSNVPTIRWTVARRYRAFEALHEELSKIYGKKTLPSLPKKSLLRSFDSSYIDSKQKGLQQYVRDLLLDPEIGRSSQLCAFLIGNFDEVFGSWLSSPLAPTQPTPMSPAAATPAPSSSSAEQQLRAELKMSMESQNGLQAQLAQLQKELETAQALQAKQQQSQQDADQQVRALQAQLEAARNASSEAAQLRAEVEASKLQQSALVDMVAQRDDELKAANEEVKTLKSHKKVRVMPHATSSFF